MQDMCSILTTYATATRYPDDEIEISEENAQSAIKDAGRIYAFCVDLVPELKPEAT